MPIDALAFEPQFVDHVAPVWRAFPDELRGRFFTDPALLERARDRGIPDPEPIEAERLRRSSAPPKASPGPGPMAFVTSIGDIKVGRRLGYRRFAFMEHGAGQAYIGDRDVIARHPSYPGGADREDVELFLCPNEYSADLWRRAYSARVEIVGCPRLDELPRRNESDYPTSPVVAVTFHWPARVIPEADTALGDFAPILPELASRFEVIGTCHPKADWPIRMERVYRRAGIPFAADFDEVCRRADLLVFDNTSAGFEFAATGRPVVVLNAKRYRRRVIHGGRFWTWADVGIQVDQAEDLGDAIAEALEDAPERRQERERVLGLVYAHRSGAAARAAAAVASWAAERVEVAA